MSTLNQRSIPRSFYIIIRCYSSYTTFLLPSYFHQGVTFFTLFLQYTNLAKAVKLTVYVNNAMHLKRCPKRYQSYFFREERTVKYQKHLPFIKKIFITFKKSNLNPLLLSFNEKRMTTRMDVMSVFYSALSLQCIYYVPHIQEVLYLQSTHQQFWHSSRLWSIEPSYPVFVSLVSLVGWLSKPS